MKRIIIHILIWFLISLPIPIVGLIIKKKKNELIGRIIFIIGLIQLCSWRLLMERHFFDAERSITFPYPALLSYFYTPGRMYKGSSLNFFPTPAVSFLTVGFIVLITYYLIKKEKKAEPTD